jgi:Ca2+-binding RTX toxin-like protein
MKSLLQILLLSLAIGAVFMMASTNPKILAAVITCVPNVPCNGTDGNDRMIGTAGIDKMDGLGGKDKMDGNGGVDEMKGGNGADTTNGGDGQDFIDELLDNSSNVISGGPDSDYVRGGQKDDTINGDAGQDILHGYGGNDKISGGIDDDVLQGLQGSDRLDGGDGSDVLVGDWDTGPLNFYGADDLKGGPGDDFLFQSAISASGPITPTTPDGFKDILDCGDGNDEAWGNVNTDHDVFKNCEVVHKE